MRGKVEISVLCEVQKPLSINEWRLIIINITNGNHLSNNFFFLTIVLNTLYSLSHLILAPTL